MCDGREDSCLLPSMISSEEEIVKTVARTYEAVVGRELVISGGPMSDLYLLNLYSRMPSLSFGIQTVLQLVQRNAL